MLVQKVSTWARGQKESFEVTRHHKSCTAKKNYCEQYCFFSYLQCINRVCDQCFGELQKGASASVEGTFIYSNVSDWFLGFNHISSLCSLVGVGIIPGEELREREVNIDITLILILHTINITDEAPDGEEEEEHAPPVVDNRRAMPGMGAV